MQNHRPSVLADAVPVSAPESQALAPEALSIKEAMALTGLGRTFLYERVTSGELPSVKVGKRRLIRRTTLLAWLASLEQGAV